MRALISSALAAFLVVSPVRAQDAQAPAPQPSAPSAGESMPSMPLNSLDPNVMRELQERFGTDQRCPYQTDEKKPDLISRTPAPSGPRVC